MKTKRTKFYYLFKTIGYVYSNDLFRAIFRDITFLLQTILDIVQISLGGKFLDSTAKIIVNSEISTIKEYFFTDSFFYLALILAILIILKFVTNIRETLTVYIREDINHKAQYELYKKIASENLEEVERKDFDDLSVFVSTYSVWRIFSTYDAFSQTVRFFIQMISAFVIMFNSLGANVLFLIIIAIPEPLIQYFGELNIQKYRLKEVQRINFLGYINQVINDVRNFAELRVNGIFSYITKTFNTEDREHLYGIKNRYKKYYSDNTIFSMIGQVLKHVYIVYILISSITLGLTLGAFKALYDYASTLYSSAYNFVRQLLIALDNTSYTEEFFTFLDYEGFGDIAEGTKKLGSGTPCIELQHLDFQYPDEPGIKVLENVNLRIEPGQKVAIVGGDGSGKSSLVKTLCGLYRIIAGDYVLDGYSIRELQRGELKNKIAVVFQNFIKYSFSLRKNIVIGKEAERVNRDLYDRVKRITGVTEFMKRENIIDDQILGKFFNEGKDISPGYWQRLAIARMLYRNKQINIMDEPFSFIDGPSREIILQNVIKELGESKTLIYISQNTDHLKFFDKVYYIYDGKVCEEGTYNELMKKRGKFYKEAMSNR